MIRNDMKTSLSRFLEVKQKGQELENMNDPVQLDMNLKVVKIQYLILKRVTEVFFQKQVLINLLEWNENRSCILLYLLHLKSFENFQLSVDLLIKWCKLLGYFLHNNKQLLSRCEGQNEWIQLSLRDQQKIQLKSKKMKISYQMKKKLLKLKKK